MSHTNPSTGKECKEFDNYDGDAVNYFELRKKYVISNDYGYWEIHFCPWCGAKL